MKSCCLQIRQNEWICINIQCVSLIVKALKDSLINQETLIEIWKRLIKKGRKSKWPIIELLTFSDSWPLLHFYAISGYILPCSMYVYCMLMYVVHDIEVVESTYSLNEVVFLPGSCIKLKVRVFKSHWNLVYIVYLLFDCKFIVKFSFSRGFKFKSKFL